MEHVNPVWSAMGAAQSKLAFFLFFFSESCFCELYHR